MDWWEHGKIVGLPRENWIDDSDDSCLDSMQKKLTCQMRKDSSEELSKQVKFNLMDFSWLTEALDGNNAEFLLNANVKLFDHKVLSQITDYMWSYCKTTFIWRDLIMFILCQFLPVLYIQRPIVRMYRVC